MFTQSIEFELLTPCFCAGADQARAEIRSSAIRGALRWWFRCLGGTPEQEEAVFGGANTHKSSVLQVRVSEGIKVNFQLPNPAPKPMTPLAYILYYPSIAGNPNGKARFGEGNRWHATGALGQGTTFTLHLRQLRKLTTDCSELLKSTICAFSHYGAIGLRVTRGFGALQAKSVTDSSFKEIDSLLEQKGFVIQKGSSKHQDWISWMKKAGTVLKEDLRKDFGAGGNEKQPLASALGSIPVSEKKLREKRWSQVPRQTSAVYLRPIKIEGNLILCAFEAPHDRVLGEASKRPHPHPVLQDRTLP